MFLLVYALFGLDNSSRFGIHNSESVSVLISALQAVFNEKTNKPWPII